MTDNTQVEVIPASQGAADRDERGMISAEWAVGLIAAIAIAGVLLAVVTNDKVETSLLDFILDVIKKFTIGFKKL